MQYNVVVFQALIAMVLFSGSAALQCHISDLDAVESFVAGGGKSLGACSFSLETGSVVATNGSFYGWFYWGNSTGPQTVCFVKPHRRPTRFPNNMTCYCNTDLCNQNVIDANQVIFRDREPQVTCKERERTTPCYGTCVYYNPLMKNRGASRACLISGRSKINPECFRANYYENPDANRWSLAINKLVCFSRFQRIVEKLRGSAV